MNDYLSGTTYQLIARGKILLSKIPKNLPREFQLLEQTCRISLSNILDGLQALSQNGKMQSGLFQPEHLRYLRRAVQDMDILETVGIAALNRAHKDDQFLNALIGHIRDEIEYPLLPPVVTSLSQHYFHIYSQLGLLCVPLGEANFLLHLPDLYHELAHPLTTEKYDPRLLPFQDALFKAYSAALEYTESELQKEKRRQGRGPVQFSFYLQQWQRCWAESWSEEFFCDLFAIYTIGPAFAWANLHLCAKRGDDLFVVPTYNSTIHPADDARMHAMICGLKLIGFSDEAEQIEKRWEALVKISGSKSEPEYRRCFPHFLLEDFAQRALQGVSDIGCRVVSPTTQASIYTILNSAWNEFWNDPIGYTEWEQQAVVKLREICCT